MAKYGAHEQPSLEGLDMYHEAHEALATAYDMPIRDPFKASVERRAQVYATLAVADAQREVAEEVKKLREMLVAENAKNRRVPRL